MTSYFMTGSARPLVRHVVALLMVALLLSAGAAAQTSHPVPGFTNPADAKLLQELRERIESLPREKRDDQGRQILIDNVERFRSEAARRQVYLSIAALSRKAGDLERAAEYSRKAGVPAGDGALPLSRQQTLDALRQAGELAEQGESASEIRDAPDLTDTQFALATRRAAKSMLRSGQPGEAVDMAIAAARERPCDRLYFVVESISVDASRSPGERGHYLRGMHWLEQNAAEFAQTSRFLASLAHAEKDAGNIDRAIELREQVVERFPDTSIAANSLLTLLRLSMSQADRNAALEYARMLDEGNYSEQMKRMGRKIVAVYSDRSARPEPAVAELQPRKWWPAVIAINAAALILLGIGWLFGRWRRSQQ